MAENLTYTRCRDYYIPDIKLSYTEPIEWNRFSRRAHTYLKEHRPILYSDLILSEQLFPYLKEIGETAARRMEQLEADLLRANPAPDKAIITIVTDSVIKGIIGLVIAFLFSPWGLPTLAAIILAQFYIFRLWLKEKIYA